MRNVRKVSTSIFMIILIAINLGLVVNVTSEPNAVEKLLAGESGKRLDVFEPDSMVVSDFEWSYVLHKFEYSEEDEEEWEDCEIHLYINDEEIKLKKKKEKQKIDKVKHFTFWFYEEFDGDSFAVGFYNWTVTLERDEVLIWSETAPLLVVDDGHRIEVADLVSMTLWSLEQSYVYKTITLTEEDYLAREPISFRVFLDEEEISLWKIVEDVDISGTIYYHLHFYQTFIPHYFEPGMYVWRTIFDDGTGVVEEESFSLTVLDNGEKIEMLFNPGSQTINTLERAFIRHGYHTDETMDYPFDVELFIDGEEMDLTFQVLITYPEGEPYFYYLFYQTFDSFYFAPGTYNLEVIWYTSKGENWRETMQLTVTEQGEQINVFYPDMMEHSREDRLFVQHGFYANVSELNTDELPFHVEIYLDGEALDLHMRTMIDYSGEEPVYYWLFYQTFERYYFELGVYNWEVFYFKNNIEFYYMSHALTISGRSYCDYGFWQEIAFNCHHPLLANKDFRRGLSQSVDREWTMDYYFQDFSFEEGEEVHQGVTPWTKAYPWYNDNLIPDSDNPNINGAQLIEQTGYTLTPGVSRDPDPDLTLLVPSNNHLRIVIAEELAYVWRDVGINISVKVMDWFDEEDPYYGIFPRSVFHDALWDDDPTTTVPTFEEGGYDMVMLGQSFATQPSMLDPIIDGNWEEQYTTGSPYNFYQYSNMTFDSKVNEYIDIGGSKQLAYEIQEILQQDCPAIILYVAYLYY